MKQDIIYDCDSVLLDYYHGFSAFLKDMDGIIVDEAGPRTYDMMEWLGATDRSFVIDRIMRFNRGEGGYFANLPPIAGAVDVVLGLRDAGHADSVLTACNDDAKTISGRISNLNSVFGGFPEVRCVALMESKRPHLVSLPKSWFIEDNIGNARLGSSIGHDTVLIEYLHNRDRDPEEDFTRVQNWSQIREIIHSAEPDIAVGL
jgi:5'(3')-deoxyribonucleotidase